VYGNRGFDRWVRRHDIKGGAAGSDGGSESADRLDPDAVHRRDSSVAKEIVNCLLLRAAAQLVSP
jgi:hypothetical protein